MNPPSSLKFADLHLHSIFSDSTYTPEELISQSIKVGLSAISLVDHDTIDGIEPTLKAAREKNIEVLPGIELSAEYGSQEVHVLGYLIDYKSKDLLEKINFLKQNRVGRIYKIVDKLKNMGVDLKAEDVFDISRAGTVSRLHVARAMLKQGKVTSIFEAFQKYIGEECPAYVLGFRFSVYEAIKLIRDIRGIPVLAHPYTLDRDELIPDFVAGGLMGLEVYYPEHSQSMINFYLNLAKQYNLLATGGSDCHGNNKSQVKIGTLKIPYDLVEKLKEAKEKL